MSNLKHKNWHSLKLTKLMLMIPLLVGSLMVIQSRSPNIVYAQSCGDLTGDYLSSCLSGIEGCNANLTGTNESLRADCYKTVYQTALKSASNKKLEGDCKDKDLTKDCGIVEYIVLFSRVLSGIVGIVIVIMITIGGVQFSTARDNPQAVAAARGRIVNALLALVFYMFSFALLQWLVPGGIL